MALEPQFDVVIVDSNIAEPDLEALRDTGVEVLLAPVPPRR